MGLMNTNIIAEPPTPHLNVCYEIERYLTTNADLKNRLLHIKRGEILAVTAPTDTGTTISKVKVGSTGWKTVVGGGSDPAYEIILKQNTTYCRKFLSGSDSNVISFRASWGEHTNKKK